MKRCARCYCLTDRAECPECSSRELEEPTDDSLVFVAQVDSFTMPIFTGLLDKRGIEHHSSLEVFSQDIRLDSEGEANDAPTFARMGIATERVYVHYKDYDKANEVLRIITGAF